LNLLDELIPDAPDIQATPELMCPGCSHAVAASVLLCTNCGYNFQTHAKAGRTSIKKSPRQATGGVIWPPLVGWLSCIIGAVGFLGYGSLLVLTVLRALKAGVSMKDLLVGLGMVSMFTWLAAWLARDGYRIAQKNPDGVKWIRIWAVAKLLIFGTCLSLLMAIPLKSLDDSLRQFRGQGGVNITAADVKQGFVLTTLFFMSWPLFILMFLFIPRIQNDVRQWD
jgi:hypothetical protein